MEAIRVLVTGAGSGVGQGIIKSLHHSKLPLHVMSSDIGPLNPGLYRTESSFLLPKSEEPGALEKIIKILKIQKPDVILIGSEYDLKLFSKNKSIIEKETGSTIIVSDIETINIGDDKYLTSEFLREHNLNFAKSYAVTNIEQACAAAKNINYPCMLKPRSGTSNRNVFLIKNENELIQAFPKVLNPVLQECLAIPSNELTNEYTCSIFKCKDGSLLGPFTARRTLRSGNSWNIEVKKFDEIHPLLISIGKHLNFCASLNVQLMMTKNGPVPFEFNARFSGTTAVRSYFGFNEPEMAIRSYFLNETIEAPTITNGIALRYLEEVFIRDKEQNNLIEPFPKGERLQWF